MTSLLFDWLLLAALVLGVLLLAFLALRIVQTSGDPVLEPWHVHVPDEVGAEAIEALDWQGYVAAEAALFDAVEEEISGHLPARDQVPINRYFKDSPVHPRGFARDWNRSFVLEPEGALRGAAVFLHGLTDSPYSLRHVARAYRDRGYLAIGIRLPGHGTVPASLTQVGWHDWTAACRLAIKEAKRRAGDALPLHLVGYSNGATLALDQALHALDDPTLDRPDQLVLISPMVGITAYARFAGIAGWPAIVPRWARTAWIKRGPEFNPFKYNSMPVHAARQSYRVTQDLQSQLTRLARSGRLDGLPPILTFQSVVDATVLTDAVVDAFYARLPAGRSELVLFDVNRSTRFGHLIRPRAAREAEALLPPAPRNFGTTIVTNRDATTSAVEARTTAAGQTTTTRRPLEQAFPAGVYSLSHVALPFPLDDSLYGLEPDPPDEFGTSLGAIATRGERNVLAVPSDDLARMSSNPFFDFMIEKIEGVISAGK